jgi:pyridoxal/pyridoxine/pyridoxamine kinase
MYAITAYHVPQNYPGTGDAFTAAALGLMLRGLPLRAAAQAAADFVRAAALATLAEEGDARHGIWYETQLAALTLAANSWNQQNSVQ